MNTPSTVYVDRPPAGASLELRSTAGVALAYLQRQHRYRAAAHSQGQPLYLLATALVVVPVRRHERRWDCRILGDDADARLRHGPTLTVCDVEIETALAANLADPLAAVDDGTYRVLWQARVRQCWSDALALQAARLLAEDLLAPGSRTVELGPEAVRHMLLGLRLLRPPGLRQLLTKFVAAGLLVPNRPGDGCQWGGYTLAAPRCRAFDQSAAAQ
jgi:hypothetical protein